MRRPDGTFAPGSTGNPGGRPKTAARYRCLLQGQVTSETFVRIVDKLIELVVNDGDTRAARLLLEYTIGKPVPIVEAENDAAPAGPTVAEIVAVLTPDEVSMLLARVEASALEAANAE